ncbi:MAG: hypothetical protein K2O03_07865, partial [Lachnospiraceae bacterium]|nr:hypothetical protein [Lachnospiraceae bacterium]
RRQRHMCLRVEFYIEKKSNGKEYITGEKKHTISASIDVNDRYAANYIPDYCSDKAAFDEIMKVTNNIINGKLLRLVKKGEFCYDEQED